MSQNSPMDEIQLPEELPLLPVRDVVVFPYMILPLFVGRDSSIRAVNEALKGDRLIFLSTQKEIRDDNPNPDRIFEVGTVAMIMRMRKLPDGRVKILAQGVAKARINEFSSIDPFYKVKFEKLKDLAVLSSQKEFDLVQEVRSQLEKVITLGKMLSPDIILVVEEISDPGRLADLVTSNLGLKVSEAQEILETLDPLARLEKVRDLLKKELEILQLQQQTKSQIKEEGVRKEAGKSRVFGDNQENLDPRVEEINEYRAKIEKAFLSDEAKAEAAKQLGRLERMHPDASEASIIRSYIDWICDLPWTKSSKDKLDLVEAKKVLDEDHYDLEKVKERILEVLAVRKLKKDNKGPIICLSGPPGVGKTSLGRSIARSMGREFIRISLGGVHDEAEIRGHRRTYVGAMPGRILQGLKQAGTNNPVVMLDEIDKLGRDYKGDPSSALLEVLDPEQNNSFRDHYMGISFDLSKALFISTANQLDTIPAPLRDRMEVIQLAGYSEEDKIRIARQYLIDKEVKENGINHDMIEFSDEGLRKIVSEYTREAGLRNFERLIGTCCRKVAHKVATWDGSVAFPKELVDEEKVVTFLGAPRFLSTDVREQDEIGVCTGLAWTQMGGEVLEVEVTSMRGKGGIMLTGSLGDVMKESCHASMSWIRAHAKELGVDTEWFSKNEIHVHFPSGAVPKDGPSAGVTITTAIVSLITGIPVKRDIAMTGEISLRGRVLPIGGVKEKTLAALRHGCTTVILPHKNMKDLMELQDEVKEKLIFISAQEVTEVLSAALTKSPFKDDSKLKVKGGSESKSRAAAMADEQGEAA
jgi:ATP-dependent Lon protease